MGLLWEQLPEDQLPHLFAIEHILKSAVRKQLNITQWSHLLPDLPPAFESEPTAGSLSTEDTNGYGPPQSLTVSFYFPHTHPKFREYFPDNPHVVATSARMRGGFDIVCRQAGYGREDSTGSAPTLPSNGVPAALGNAASKEKPASENKASLENSQVTDASIRSWLSTLIDTEDVAHEDNHHYCHFCGR